MLALFNEMESKMIHGYICSKFLNTQQKNTEANSNGICKLPAENVYTFWVHILKHSKHQQYCSVTADYKFNTAIEEKMNVDTTICSDNVSTIINTNIYEHNGKITLQQLDRQRDKKKSQNVSRTKRIFFMCPYGWDRSDMYYLMYNVQI
jgi:hypothetical protein